MEKKKFLNHAIHELKTPLAIIALNNDMLQYNRYSNNIKTAIKQLRYAYDNMVFFQKLNKNSKNIRCLNVTPILIKCLKYFKEVAANEEKNLNLIYKEDFNTL